MTSLTKENRAGELVLWQVEHLLRLKLKARLAFLGSILALPPTATPTVKSESTRVWLVLFYTLASYISFRVRQWNEVPQWLNCVISHTLKFFWFVFVLFFKCYQTLGLTFCLVFWKDSLKTPRWLGGCCHSPSQQQTWGWQWVASIWFQFASTQAPHCTAKGKGSQWSEGALFLLLEFRSLLSSPVLHFLPPQHLPIYGDSSNESQLLIFKRNTAQLS